MKYSIRIFLVQEQMVGRLVSALAFDMSIAEELASIIDFCSVSRVSGASI